MAREGHDRVIAVQDQASGLRAWIALHHLGSGPAYGGIRVWSYRTEADALHDALRLSRAMTFKCVLAGVPGGGGKTVVIADHLVDRVAAMEALGREIEALGGAYRTGPDAGFTEEDRTALMRETSHSAHFYSGGQLRSAGEATAEGAAHGILAALRSLGNDSFAGTTIAIQGLGSVGSALARRCLAAGAKVFGADPDRDAAARAKQDGVELVSPDRLLEVPCDVLAPCALGGTIHDLSISRLQTRIVAAVANNTLGHRAQGSLLQERGILFLPDIVLNAGALIEGSGFAREGRTDFGPELAVIGTTMEEVLRRSQESGEATLEVALHMAQERFDARQA